tara:strand:+ start:574 stop:735 length:162 start_codon:yes stop_codon:yes gene_type:complete
MVVKVYLTLDLDKDEYPVPADGDPSEEIQQALEEFIYDIDGLKVKNIRITLEG